MDEVLLARVLEVRVIARRHGIVGAGGRRLRLVGLLLQRVAAALVLRALEGAAGCLHSAIHVRDLPGRNRSGRPVCGACVAARAAPARQRDDRNCDHDSCDEDACDRIAHAPAARGGSRSGLLTCDALLARLLLLLLATGHRSSEGTYADALRLPVRGARPEVRRRSAAVGRQQSSMKRAISFVRRSGAIRSSRIEFASTRRAFRSSRASSSASENGCTGSRGCPITSVRVSIKARSERGGAVRPKKSPCSTAAEGPGSWLAQSSPESTSVWSPRGISRAPRATKRASGLLNVR